MWVKHLGLTDFRCYSTVELDLQPGITTFVGSNGQGKTNLVEAIGYLATLGSHRVASDAPLVRVGQGYAIVRASVENDDRTILLELAITPGKANRARINQSPVPKVRDVLGIVRTVVFAPEDLALVKGDPSDRRRFIDDLLIQRTPRLAGTRADYDRVLKQRNALLKTAGVARRAAAEPMLRTLEVWDEQLVTHGSELIAARIALLNDLAVHATDKYTVVSGDRNALLTSTYASSLAGVDAAVLGPDRDAWSTALNEAIEKRRTDELNRGITLVGPHRDDIDLALGPVPAKGYASHGESWSIALALRLASFELLTQDGVDPILVLDDVFAELDAKRRAALSTQVTGATQVLITAAVAEDVPTALRGARFQVSDGSVMPV